MKRAKVTVGTYVEKKQTAIEKLTGASTTRASPDAGPEREEQKMVTILSEPVQEEEQRETRNLKPTSIYFHPNQLVKLDDMAYAYNRRTGKRINRNDILRYLVDQCRVEDLLTDGGVI